METPQGYRRSTSPPLPSARSLFQRTPDVSADCQRPLPRLQPLPPLGDDGKTLMVFLHLDGATSAAGLQPIRAISPRPVGTKTQKVEDKKRTRDFDGHRSSSDDGTEGETPRCRKRSNSTGRKPTYLVRKEEKDELTKQIDKLKAQLEYLKHTASLHRCDIQQRRLVLEGMKAQKLRDAKQLMDRRIQFLRDPAEQRRETAQFPTDSGSLCSVVFDVTPLDAGVEVDDFELAYRAALAYTKRMGTMIPPYTGDDAGVVHSRLQVDTAPEMPTESNFVVFSELQVPKFASTESKASEGSRHADPVGLLVIDSVDEDELHPFRPKEFLREDVNAVITMSKGSRRVQNGDDTSKRVPCLVLTRWVLLTLRPDQKGIAPSGAMDFLLQTCINMGNEMLQAIQEDISSAKTVKPWSFACSSTASSCTLSLPS